MRCAEACFDNNNCTFFTYSSKSSICSLKKVTDITFSQIAVSTQQQGSLCGLIDKRLRSSANSSSVSLFGLQWTTSPDGSYLLSPGCSFPVPDNTIITTSTFDACAQECKGRPQQCTYFVFAPGNSYCLMNKKSDPQFSGRAIGTTCGIVSQYSSSLFNNVEFMTNYSNSEKQEFITTSTAATTTTAAAAASQDYFDIDFIEW